MFFPLVRMQLSDAIHFKPRQDPILAKNTIKYWSQAAFHHYPCDPHHHEDRATSNTQVKASKFKPEP
jgi:hypothetical protein